jgi:hypothetical protein
MYTLQRNDNRYFSWSEYGLTWEFVLCQSCILPPSFLCLLRYMRRRYGGEIRRVA